MRQRQGIFPFHLCPVWGIGYAPTLTLPRRGREYIVPGEGICGLLGGFWVMGWGYGFGGMFFD